MKDAKDRMWRVLNRYGMSRHKTKLIVAIRKFASIRGDKIPETKKQASKYLLQLYRDGKIPSDPSNMPKGKRAKKLRLIRARRKHEFYDSERWIILKTSILRKYGCKCMKCKTTKVQMHVDHIKPRSKYPELEWDENNLQVLCKDCNMEKSNLNEIDYRPR